MACEKPKNIHNVNSVSLKMNIAKGFKENNLGIATMLDMLPVTFINRKCIYLCEF